MNKRGQVTIFIILGIILLVVIAILVFLRNIGINPPPIIPTRTISLKDHVENCINTVGSEALNLLGKQGGDISPSLFQNYCYNNQCFQLSYLCYTEELKPCLNRRPFLIDHMESQLLNYLQENLPSCINDFSEFQNSGYSVQASSNLNVKTTIGENNVIIIVNYPIKITKGDITQETNRYSKTFDVPLGLLGETAQDIVDSEISIGDFQIIPYTLLHHGQVEIQKKRPYQSKVYILNKRNNQFTFQFATRSYVL